MRSGLGGWVKQIFYERTKHHFMLHHVMCFTLADPDPLQKHNEDAFIWP